MATAAAPDADGAEVVLPCRKLLPTLEFFTSRLGFVLDMIMPADDPAVAVLTRGGVRIRLVRDDGEPRIERVDHDGGLHLPPLTPMLELSRFADSGWGTGRAGMLYRDLLPRRQRGRFIASHIRIPDAGPVPDDVHHHHIRFQMIYCVAGWVRLVYEDQGPPFVLAAGDCVLQPPHIRHRVLESSAGLEVVEIGCPAAHETFFDHRMELPTATHDPQRRFGGQRFAHHTATTATWKPWGQGGGFEARDTGIGMATDGVGGARVVRPTRSPSGTEPLGVHGGELRFWFVVAGAASLSIEDRPDETLTSADAVAIPAGLAHSLRSCSDDLELLEVTVPDRLVISSPASPRC